MKCVMRLRRTVYIRIAALRRLARVSLRDIRSVLAYRHDQFHLVVRIRRLPRICDTADQLFRDSDHGIDCKIAGIGAMILKSGFVKKA
jgi:hypothetical protein